MMYSFEKNFKDLPKVLPLFPGFHAGDEKTMDQVIRISKENNVSIGAHPSFNDPQNFGRKRLYLPEHELKKLIIDQYEILQNIAKNHGTKDTHTSAQKTIKLKKL